MLFYLLASYLIYSARLTYISNDEQHSLAACPCELLLLSAVYVYVCVCLYALFLYVCLTLCGSTSNNCVKLVSEMHLQTDCIEPFSPRIYKLYCVPQNNCFHLRQMLSDFLSGHLILLDPYIRLEQSLKSADFVIWTSNEFSMMWERQI